MMGNLELAPEVDVNTLEPLLSPSVVSELLDTYMSTLTVSKAIELHKGYLWDMGMASAMNEKAKGHLD